MNSGVDTVRLRVELSFLRPDEGGRTTAVNLADGRYRPLVAPGIREPVDLARSDDQPPRVGAELWGGPSTVQPGSVARAELTTLNHPPAVDLIASAGAFTVFEGHNVVARGTVIGHDAG